MRRTRNIELVGGPKAGRFAHELPDPPPVELPVLVEQGPRLPVEEDPRGSLPGVQTWAVYRFVEEDDADVLVYAYSHPRTVQG